MKVEGFVDNTVNTNVISTKLISSPLLGSPTIATYSAPRTYGLRVGLSY